MAPSSCARQVALAVAVRVLRQAALAVRILFTTVFLVVKEANAAAMHALAKVANVAQTSTATNIQ